MTYAQTDFTLEIEVKMNFEESMKKAFNLASSKSPSKIEKRLPPSGGQCAKQKKGPRIPHESEEHMTLDHRVAGSSPSRYKLNSFNDLRLIFAAKSRSFGTVY